ncbi:MAG: TauD/TfdA family dioxygenase [Rhodospirillales bacterium]|nr:TauD/TfdA family dioxygenase [Rhodospirillales bacterium]
MPLTVTTPPTSTFGFETNSLSPALGLEIVGLNVAGGTGDETIADLTRLVSDHGVILFRDQTIDPDTQIGFSRRFGPLQEVAQKQYQMAGQPLIYVIGNVTENGRPIGDPSVGRLWHSDQSFLQHPAFGSLLFGVECPPEGAETLFANMYRAYETLPETIRRRIDGLHAVHSFSEYYEELRHRDPTQPALTETRRALYPDVTHPMVRRNPQSGRKALYVNPGYTTRVLGLADDEGRDLLEFLFSHCQQEHLVYSHAWRSGDLLFWNNLAVNHKGTAFDTERYVRRMHRTTVAGNSEMYRASLLLH